MSEARKVVFHSARQVDAEPRETLELFADHNSADNPIRCSLRNIRSMAGYSCGSTNIRVMTETNEIATPRRATISVATPITGHHAGVRQ